MKKNLLLTGGAGYIGSWFLAKYSDDYNIKVIDTFFFNGEDNLIKYKVPFLKKDIREININDLEGIDYVVHMAELSNDPLGEINSQLTKSINIDGTKKLLELSKKTSIEKFIYMSSCSVYGDSGDSLVSENSATNPLTEYAKAKIVNEKFLLENQYDFEIKILRNATAFGYSENTRTDLVINDLSLSALKNDVISVLSDGSPRRPFVHIGDISRFINHLIKYDNTSKLLINVGSQELNFTVKEIANLVGNITGVKNISFGESDNDARSYFVNFEKINNEFSNFKFKFKIEDGIKEFIENYEYIVQNKLNAKRLNKIKTLLTKNNLDSNLFWRI